MKILLQWSILLTYSAFQPSVFHTSLFESLQGSQSKNKNGSWNSRLLYELNKQHFAVIFFTLYSLPGHFQNRKALSSHFQSITQDEPQLLQTAWNFTSFYLNLDYHWTKMTQNSLNPRYWNFLLKSIGKKRKQIISYTLKQVP